MPKKGNCYEASIAVAEAIAKCKWTTQKFFAEAKKFGGVNGFDAEAEAKKFEDRQAVLTANSKCTIPPPVVAFADWVLIKDIKDIHARLIK